MSDLKNVVVLGLGQAGITVVKALAKTLPSTHRLVVVHQHNFSFYAIASLRAHAVPGWEKKVAAPIENLFGPTSRHVLLASTKVVELKENSVVVDQAHEAQGFGTEIPFEYAVVATGATYAPHCQIPAGLTSLKDVERLYSGYQSEIKDAQSIVVVGAGYTGIEAAGEFKELYPEKEVAMICATPRLLPTLTTSVSAGTLTKLQDLGVNVIFDAKVDTSILDSGKISKKTLQINGQQVTVDYIFVAYGFKPNSGFVPPQYLDNKGLIKVESTLQIVSTSNVFAVGDINDIIAPFVLGYMVNIGFKAGVGQIFGWKVPNWFVVMVKSGHLRTEVWKSEFATLPY